MLYNMIYKCLVTLQWPCDVFNTICDVYKQSRNVSIRHSYTYKWILILIQVGKMTYFCCFEFAVGINDFNMVFKWFSLV